ncbi:hypothetical protein BH24ACT5_BH24ACT5_22540 [soil metagenome]
MVLVAVLGVGVLEYGNAHTQLRGNTDDLSIRAPLRLFQPAGIGHLGPFQVLWTESVTVGRNIDKVLGVDPAERTQ